MSSSRQMTVWYADAYSVVGCLLHRHLWSTIRLFKAPRVEYTDYWRGIPSGGVSG